MADQFQIPQPTAPAPQFQPPTSLVESYLNRPTGYQVGTQQMGQGLQSLLDYQLKQQQLKAGAFEAGGPYLMNLLYGKGQGAAPQGAPAAQTMPPANHDLVGQSPQGIPGQNQPQASSALEPTAQTLQAPDSQPSEAIHASVQNMGHPDFAGHVARMSSPAGAPPDVSALAAQAGQYQNMGKYGREQTQNLQSQGALAMLPMQAQKTQLEMQKAGNDIAMQPTERALKEQELYNAQHQIPMEVGKGSAQQGDEFTKSNVKTGSGFDAFQQLEDAWNAVPANQKGPAVGMLTSNANDLVSGKYPEAVAYNKLREGLIGSIVAGIDPQGRQGPSLLEQMQKAVPTLQTSPAARKLLMGSLYKQLKSQSDRNYRGYSDAAKAFGGNIPPPNTPLPPDAGAAANGSVTIRDSQGGMHTLPAANLNAAKKRDPGLQVVTQ